MNTFSTLTKSFAKGALDLTASLLGPHQFSPSKQQLWVLMYHRILPKHDPRYAKEEPGMIVEPETFKQQLQIIKRHFTPIHLSEWVTRQQQGLPLPAKACAITFDDGWVDNAEYAYPIIQEQQVPITLFAVSDMIGTDRQFWPNQIIQLLDSPTDLLETITWLAPHLSSLTAPREAASYTINRLKKFSDEQIYSWLADLPTTPENNNNIVNTGLMSWEQLKTMSQNNLVEVGSHTRNHFRLNGQLDEQILNKEIISSKQHLQEELGQAINLFCYPNGDICPKTIELVQQHYQAAVTTQRGINKADTNQLHTLTRIGIHQDRSHSETLFKARLANWF